MKKQIELLMKKIREMPNFDRVKFIILFGSHVLGKANKMSDYDFAIYHDGNDIERFNFRINLAAKLPNKFDIQIFQNLPLYVQKEVLKGKLIYSENSTFMYETIYKTIKRFEDFKKYYYDYIGMQELK